MTQPLTGVKVLDFGTLLPGPLATLILAEAGAQVVKIERPGRGDEMRSYVPKFGRDSVNFALLNRGKRSLAVDLKADTALDILAPLIREADIVVEQFRPGVLDRLGFGYEALGRINPGLIYASITGYGQTGPYAQTAAHDLNYCAQTGLLSLAAAADGAPVVPAALVADIAGGAYPAVINLLLALRQRDQTGRGCRLDIAMADNLFPLMYWALGDGLAADRWPTPGGALVTGGSPRYGIYRTADDRYLAAAPLEEKFWSTFCALIGLGGAEADDQADPAAVKAAIARKIAQHPAAYWQALFEGQDVCCNLVASVQEAIEDPNVGARGVFKAKLEADGQRLAALPVPIADIFRSPAADLGYPSLGEANADMIDGRL